MDSPAKNTRSQHRKGTLGAQPRKLGDLTDIHTGRKLGGGGLADTGATNKQAQAPTSALDMAKSGVPTKRKATSADDGSRARAAPRTTSKEGAAAPTSTRPISKAEERRKAATERRLKMEAEKKAGRLAKQEARMARTGSGEGPAASSRGVSRTGSGESRLNRHPAPRTARSTTASDAAEAAGRPKRAPRQPQADSRSKGRRGAPAVDYKDRLDKMEATLSKMVQGQGGEQPCDQDAPAAAGEAEAHLAALMEGQEAAKSRAEELTAQLAATTEAQAQALAAAAEAHGAEVEALRATHATEMKTLAEAKDATIAALEEAATVAAAAHGSELQQAQEAHSTAAAEVSRLTTLSEDRARDIEALKSSLASQAASLSSVEAKLRATELALEQERGAHASTSQARATAEAQVAEQSEQIAGLEAKSRVDEALRKKLHNTVQELKGNIRVYCRVRPLLGAEAAAEQAAEGPQLFSLPSKHEIVITDPVQRKTVDGSGTTARKSEFDFDHVFGGDASQAEVFEELSQLVQSAVDGYKVCIFCYGQTGSGKTHTMQGPDGCEDTPGAPECGLIPRSVEQIFDTAAGNCPTASRVPLLMVGYA
jgi:kinesin family protein C1